MRRALTLIGVSLLLAGLIYGADREFSAMEAIGRFREEGDYVRARQNLERFKNSIAGKIVSFVSPLASQVDYEEAMIFALSGEHKKAREMMERLLVSETGSTRKASVYYTLGNLALITDNDFEKAVEYYQSALELNPQHEKARINLELLLREIEKERRAAEELGKESKEGKEKEGEGKKKGEGRKRSLLESKELWGGSQPSPGPSGPRY